MEVVWRRSGPLSPSQKEKAAKVRKVQACLRCRLWKVTCDEETPCNKCQSQERRTLSIPCVRFEIKTLDVGFTQFPFREYIGTTLHSDGISLLLDQQIDTKKFCIESPIVSSATADGPGNESLRNCIKLVLAWKYYESGNHDFHADDFYNICCTLQKQVLAELHTLFSLGRATALEEWWMIYIKSVVLLSFWNDVLRCMQRYHTELNIAADVVIGLFGASTARITENQVLECTSKWVIEAIRTNYEAMQDFGRLGPPAHWSRCLPRNSGSI